MARSRGATHADDVGGGDLGLIVSDVEGAKAVAAPAGPQTDAELFGVAARRAAAREPFALCTVVGTARCLVRPAARLVLYGAGHVGERVANIATAAGLSTVVIDDRTAFAQPHRFPRAAEVRCADLEKDPLGGLRPGPEDFVVILTRCHALDEGVLEAALRTPARYVGLIGSRRKVALILRSIARWLGSDPRGDPRLHPPIGLRLGDKSPGEIAISILAEVLLIKSNGKLAHNRLGIEGRTTVLGVARAPSF